MADIVTQRIGESAAAESAVPSTLSGADETVTAADVSKAISDLLKMIDEATGADQAQD